LIYSAADLENILLDSNGNCKLSNFRKTLDFIKYSTQQEGNRLDEHTVIHQFFPSDDYTAPELLKNFLKENDQIKPPLKLSVVSFLKLLRI